MNAEGEREYVNDALRRHSMRQLVISEPASWLLRKPLAKLYDPATLGRIIGSQNTRRIEYDLRITAAHAGNWLRTDDLRPVRGFLKALSDSTADSYYRREALEHFSIHLATSVKNRGLPWRLRQRSISLRMGSQAAAISRTGVPGPSPRSW